MYRKRHRAMLLQNHQYLILIFIKLKFLLKSSDVHITWSIEFIQNKILHVLIVKRITSIWNKTISSSVERIFYCITYKNKNKFYKKVSNDHISAHRRVVDVLSICGIVNNKPFGVRRNK